MSRRLFCKFAFVIPFTICTDAASTTEYDQYASSYEVLDGLTRLTNLLGFDNLRTSLLGHAHGDVLELAAGTGINFPLYPSTVTSLTALDVSSGMLQTASLHVSQANLSIPSIKCIIADASNTSLPQSSFDTVVVTFGFCVFDDPKAVVSEIYRLLKSNGQLLVLDYGMSHYRPIGAYQTVVAPVVKHLSKGCVPNLNLPQLFCQAGFKVVARSAILGDTVMALRLQPVHG